MPAALLLGLVGWAAPAAAQDATAGAQAFKQCAICHSVSPGKGAAIGPNLGHVVGRKAGSMAGFRYSPRMAAAGFTWDAARLDAFLARPQAVVPGNRMAFGGVADAKRRADIIAYLKTLGK